MYKMNEERKRLWIEALRSGKYKQGRGLLRRRVLLDDIEELRYCCLGVACELYREAHPENAEWGEDDMFVIKSHGLPQDQGNVVLLPTVRDWLGLPSNNPMVDTEYFADNSLAGINDSSIPFITIAALIEENF